MSLMAALLIVVVVLLTVNLGVLCIILFMLREFRQGAHAALQSVQVQLAFIGGRIGLDKRDLDRAVSQEAEPDLPTEVLGSTGWGDWEEEYAGGASEPSTSRTE